MPLTDKIAIVTGASKGVGLEIARQLLERGVKVAGWSRTQPPITHENFLFCPTDTGNLDSVQAAYESTVRHFSDDISILVNNAGLGYMAAFEELDPQQWVEMFNTNVHGIFYCSRLMIPAMKKRREGSIINIASTSARKASENFAGYCGSKFAVSGISQSMFLELREFGIKVTCVYLGAVNTRFFDQMSIEANSNMMSPKDAAAAIVHVLDSPANMQTVEVEIRSMGARKK